MGFEQAGYNIAWAIEKDFAACKTYRFNFPNTKLIENDIRNEWASAKKFLSIKGLFFPLVPFSGSVWQNGRLSSKTRVASIKSATQNTLIRTHYRLENSESIGTALSNPNPAFATN